MMKRSCLVVALGLLASLAFVTPSQAGPTFPLAYSYSVAQSGGPTITATSVNGGSGSATVHAAAAGSALAPLAPAATDSYISIASYTQHASGGFYAAGSSVSEAVTVTYMGHTGVFNVVVSFAGQFVYTGNLATPSLTSSGPIVIDGVTFGVYEQATSFNNNTQVSSVKIGIEGTAVPEPTSMALLGIGMTSFLAFRRFFKRGSVA
jgi:hypothetical protein